MYETPELETDVLVRSSAIRIHDAEAFEGMRKAGRLVAEALSHGKLTSWDHQPWVDASQQYMRNHIDLDDLERRARFPAVG